MSVNSGAIVVAHELKAPLSLVRQLALSLELEDSVEGVHAVSYTHLTLPTTPYV